MTSVGSLQLFLLGLVSKGQAVDALGLRDYSALLIALGEAGLPLPIEDEPDLAEQVETFATTFKMT